MGRATLRGHAGRRRCVEDAEGPDVATVSNLIAMASTLVAMACSADGVGSAAVGAARSRPGTKASDPWVARRQGDRVGTSPGLRQWW